MTDAPGRPGIEPRWTSSDKSGIGTALSPRSRVWFTTSHGILNEIYYPRVDQACTRDFGFIVTDREQFFAEEKRDTVQAVATVEDGVPASILTNTHTGGRFRIIKRVIADPRREVVLQHVRLERLADGPALHLYALLAPHLVNGGANNTAWIGEYKGQTMLFAEGHGTVLALAASCPWSECSVGYVGVSDGWQDLSRNFRLTARYDRAPDGNVALTAGLAASEGEECILALGFGRSWSEAAFRTRASLQKRFATLEEEYARQWRDWQATLRPLDRVNLGRNTYRISTAVLRAHESPSFPGGIIASLSIPWGSSVGDDDLGGYHLVWPRDLVMTGTAFLACGAADEARRVLDYLRAVQEPNGRWPQNSWLDGIAYWRGVQMDETAFPILLVDLAWRCAALPKPVLADFWPMVRAAAGFVVRHGPATAQDRWEENPGYSPFTLAVEIAALLAAADLAELHGEPRMAGFLRDTADAWNDRIEEWTYASGTPLARHAGVDGYYVRIAPPVPGRAEAALDAMIPIRNRPAGAGDARPADSVVSPDALALVRFGLRDASDPAIRNTIRAIDHALRTELPHGPCWRRYSGDGYGEHADGGPFDGTGIGRLWPLLTGERAHAALAAGRTAEASELLATFEACASAGGMLPEQIWDDADIPARELQRGRPSGSAMPLVWAHSEHLKLLRSLADGVVFDTPPQTVRRYLRAHTRARCQPWRPDWISDRMAPGLVLRVELRAPGFVRWTADDWGSEADAATWDSGLGAHVAELPTETLPAGASVQFTWCGADGVWAGRNFAVTIAAAPGALAEPAEREGNVAQLPRPWSRPAAATGGCGA